MELIAQGDRKIDCALTGNLKGAVRRATSPSLGQSLLIYFGPNV